MKKLLFILLILMLPMVASADPIEINGIYYNLIKKAKVAEVTCKPNYNENEKYSGNIEIPESVTYEDETYTVAYVGKSAFLSCSQLTSVAIPATVTYIMDYAFSGCSGLGAITIPNSVTTINDYAFQNCTGLTTINIPNSVSTLGKYVFQGCSNLASVFIPNSIFTIGDYSFQNCSSLTSIEIPNSVTSIGTGAFAGCTSFTAITIPDNVIKIGSGAFSDCINLSSISLPTTLTSIEATVFQNCSSLTSITLPNNVTYIGTSAFKGCTGLSSISIPRGVNTINKSAFQGCSSLISISLPDNLSEITWGAFSDCKSLTEITLPEKITRIMANAFSGCSNLASITIGGNVNYIANRAFALCSELKDFYCCAKSVPDTSADAFEDSYIEFATLHVPLTSIKAYKEADPWKNFKEIKYMLIQGDTSGSFGKNVTFDYKAATQTLTISGTGAMTDYNNPNSAPCYGFKEEIKTIIIEEGITHVGECDFYEFVNLTSVSLPNSLISIGAEAFKICSALESIVIPDAVTNIGGAAFKGCSNLNSVTLPKALTVLSEGVFSWCGFKQFTIPDGVLKLENGCICECQNLEEITIPASVKYIEGLAFASNPKLQEVYCFNREVPNTGSRVFEGSKLSGNLHVPYSSVNLYKASSPWNSFANIVALPITKEELLEKIETNINIMKSTEQSLQDAYDRIAKIDNFEPGQLSSFAEAVRQNIKDYDAVIAKLESLKEKLNNGETVTEEEIDNLKCEELSTALLERLSAYEEYVMTTSFTSNEGGQINVGNINVKNETKKVSWFYSKAFISDPHSDVYKSVEISVVPSDGYHIKSIDIDGKDYTSTTSYTGDGLNAKNFIATFEQDTKPTYKLLFVVDGETYKSYDLEEGTPITPEAEPTKEGYTFSGWSEIPSTMPAKDVTITGSFTINKYKLTYKVDGEVYKEFELEYGASITPEPAPTKEGYTFSGWSEIPSTMPAKDVTVTGNFTKGTYKLVYKVDGEVYKTISYNYGDAITPEPAPTKEGYTFSGWSDIPSTMPAKDVTITGSFTINKYKLTYIVDGEIYKEYDIEYGATITPEPAPTKEGYEFSGWSDIPSTMPANNVEITGSFKQIDYKVEGATYEISGEGTVSIKGGDQKGNVEISGTVVINGQTYKVTAIAENAFVGNTQITSVTIPEGITTIGSNAFSGCVNMLVINIGKSVSSIGNKAFANVGTSSTAKTRGENSFIVNCYAESVPQTAADAFENSPIATGTLLVNDNIVDAYKTTSPWSQFGKIQGFQEAAGIGSIIIDNPNAHIYDMQGNRIDNLQKGVNIIRLEDGKTKKVIVK